VSNTQVPRKPRTFRQIVLRETVILLPTAIIFAVYQGGSFTDWLISIAAVLVLGLAFGWLMNERQKIAQKPMPQRALAKPAKRKRRR
jgi:hypothetical protein